MTVEQFADRMAGVDSRLSAAHAQALDKVKPLLLAGIRENFDTASASDGSPWPPHSDEYVARVGAHPLLVLTGALAEAATGQGQGAIDRRPDQSTIELGVDTSAFGEEEGAHWGQVHQQGSSDGRIPARPFMGISDETADACAEVAADLLVGSIF
jgi:phage gpG-like protein